MAAVTAYGQTCRANETNVTHRFRDLCVVVTISAIGEQQAMMSRRHRIGHYCWSCGRMRANEKFSGRGHAQHLCKECARLGKDELAYRQAVRNLDRLLAGCSIVPHKKREQFRQYLHHTNERVRAYAIAIEAADALERAERRLRYDVEAFLEDVMAEENILRWDEEPLVDSEAPEGNTDLPF
jgi:hypothetical protein